MACPSTEVCDIVCNCDDLTLHPKEECYRPGLPATPRPVDCMVPGGDYDPSILATCEVNDVGAYTWGAAKGMTEDIQRWVNNPPGNFGWILIGQELDAQTGKRFDSRESPDAPSRPMLVVHFTPPHDSGESIEGDLNGDRRVDFADMAILAGQWLADATEPGTPSSVTIAELGEFSYDPAQVRTLRPDIFQPDHFSVFDVLVHLDRQGKIDMVYHFDENSSWCVPRPGTA